MSNRIGLAQAFGIMGVDLDAVAPDPARHRLIGKLFFQGAGARPHGSLLMVCGAVIIPPSFPVAQDTAEMWSGSITLNALQRCIDTKHHFRGMGLAGALVSGFGDPYNYGKVIDF